MGLLLLPRDLLLQLRYALLRLRLPRGLLLRVVLLQLLGLGLGLLLLQSLRCRRGTGLEEQKRPPNRKRKHRPRPQAPCLRVEACGGGTGSCRLLSTPPPFPWKQREQGTPLQNEPAWPVWGSRSETGPWGEGEGGGEGGRGRERGREGGGGEGQGNGEGEGEGEEEGGEGGGGGMKSGEELPQQHSETSHVPSPIFPQNKQAPQRLSNPEQCHTIVKKRVIQLLSYLEAAGKLLSTQ